MPRGNLRKAGTRGWGPWRRERTPDAGNVPRAGLLIVLVAAMAPALPALAAAPPTAPKLFVRAADLVVLSRFGQEAAEPRDPFAGFRKYAFAGTPLVDSRILAFEEHQLFTMIVGDLSPPAPQGRDIVLKDPSPGIVRRLFLLKPATVVIDDAVRRGVPGKRAAWSIQSTGEPKIADRRIRIVEGEHELLLETFLPANRRVEKSLRAAGRPQAGYVFDILPEPETPAARFLNVLRIRALDQKPAELTARLLAKGDSPELAVQTDQHEFRLSLPSWSVGAGHIAVVATDGATLVERRPLASGILPHSPDGVKTIERWDQAYQGGRRPGWDTGRPSSELVEAVEQGTLKPCRALELGCGSGTNAIFLAQRGFDVTAIDLAPSALAAAEQKAQKEGARVRFLLADVLAPPKLEPFEFVYDRGCYHGVRRQNAAGYVEALRRLTKPGSRVLILAGNANEPPPHYGPPRVNEEELRADFSNLFEFESLRETRFDTADPNKKGALAWIVLLRRK